VLVARIEAVQVLVLLGDGGLALDARGGAQRALRRLVGGRRGPGRLGLALVVRLGGRLPRAGVSGRGLG